MIKNEIIDKQAHTLYTDNKRKENPKRRTSCDYCASSVPKKIPSAL